MSILQVQALLNRFKALLQALAKLVYSNTRLFYLALYFLSILLIYCKAKLARVRLINLALVNNSITIV